MPRSNYKGLLFIVDPHLASRIPGFRKDNYPKTILAKLRWAKLSGGSEKQYTDALRVYELQHALLDLEYLEQWVGELGLRDLWTRLQDEARPLP